MDLASRGNSLTVHDVDAPHPSFRAALRFWLKLGFISFGGPAGQIAIMHAELVEKKRWIDEERFLHALNFCMLLPGPEATQLAIYCGWWLHRVWGGIVAGVLFVLPAAVLLWGLSYVYVVHGQVPWISAVFYGLKPAVTAIVVAAVIRIGQRSLNDAIRWLIATAAFVLIFFCQVPFPLIVAGAAVLGWIRGSSSTSSGETARESVPKRPVETTWRRALVVTGVCGALWGLPVLAAGVLHGWNGSVFREGVFFSKAAMVTFGGAYAVLPYVGQHAVEQQSWLTASQMLDGLGLAETTPGPLIMVVQFVGFLGGWNHPGGLRPIVAATLGAAITTWTTFVPCFLWILVGAPHIEQLRRVARLSAALATVTAAVVGVMLNLAVWFGLQTLRVDGKIDGFAVVVCLLAFFALHRLRWSIVSVVVLSGVVGLLWRQFT